MLNEGKNKSLSKLMRQKRSNRSSFLDRYLKVIFSAISYTMDDVYCLWKGLFEICSFAILLTPKTIYQHGDVVFCENSVDDTSSMPVSMNFQVSPSIKLSNIILYCNELRENWIIFEFFSLFKLDRNMNIFMFQYWKFILLYLYIWYKKYIVRISL